ncbi:MAG: cell division ATP-binding protein FtsE, partial [Flexibacteraceae bacterium]
MSISQLPVLEYVGVNIAHSEKTVLEQATFSIAKGEFVYLVGRTGSGKSSLLKSIYGDVSIASGAANVAGIDLAKLKKSQIPTLRRQLGIIFQDFQLLSDRSVFDNLVFVMKATGWNNLSDIRRRANEVLLQVGLPNVGQRLPHQLSGGEQQRIAIARALINEPKLLVADEPTGNLDPIVGAEILRIFKAINNSGTAILMATHNHYLIKEFPARVLRCSEGKVEDITNIELA